MNYVKFKKGWPAVNADGDVIMGLNGAHLLQQFQNRRDGVRYTVIRPVDIVQLFQSSARLEIKKKKVFLDNFKASLFSRSYICWRKKPLLHILLLYILWWEL